MDKTGDKTLAELETSSAGWSTQLAEGNYDTLQTSLAGYSAKLLSFLSGHEISALPMNQQRRLHTLLVQHRRLADDISARKQDAARQLAGLRKGKNLASTYSEQHP